MIRPSRFTPEQRRVVSNRIDELYGYTPRAKANADARVYDTPEVKEARQLTAKFDKANAARVELACKRFAKAEKDARTKLAFITTTEAGEAFLASLKPLKIGGEE